MNCQSRSLHLTKKHVNGGEPKVLVALDIWVCQPDNGLSHVILYGHLNILSTCMCVMLMHRNYLDPPLELRTLSQAQRQQSEEDHLRG
jgi:hypothetical protein